MARALARGRESKTGKSLMKKDGVLFTVWVTRVPSGDAVQLAAGALGRVKSSLTQRFRSTRPGRGATLITVLTCSAQAEKPALSVTQTSTV